MDRKTLHRIAIAGIASLGLILAACSGGGYTRGIFEGYVIGKTEAEIVDRVGQPTSIDRNNPESPVLVFHKKTFDPDNRNQIDTVTHVYLRKDEKGKTVAANVSFSG